MLLTELRRKAVHVATGLLTIIPIIYFNQSFLLKFIATFVTVILFLHWWIDLRKQRRRQVGNLVGGLFETMYLEKPKEDKELERAEEGFFKSIAHNVTRSFDRTIFLPSFYYLVGLLISLIFFGKEVLVFGILALSIGDAAAALVGRAWQAWRWPTLGRIPWDKRKSFAGSFGFLAFTFLASAIFLYFFPHFVPLGWIRAGLVAGAVGAFIETIPFVNDNFSIPVVVSGTVWMFAYFLV